MKDRKRKAIALVVLVLAIYGMLSGCNRLIESLPAESDLSGSRSGGITAEDRQSDQSESGGLVRAYIDYVISKYLSSPATGDSQGSDISANETDR